MSDVVTCERCDGTGRYPPHGARYLSEPRYEPCPDCQGHGFLLTCRCGHLMPVGESMCSLCESQAEAREEER